MPNYGVAQAGSNPNTPSVVSLEASPPGSGGAAGQPGGFNLVGIQAGDNIPLFNAETPTSPQASIAVCKGWDTTGANRPLRFSISFDGTGGTPTATVCIQGSNVDNDTDYQTLYTSENLQFDNYSDPGGFAFYRAWLKTGSVPSGSTLTVRVKA